MALFTSALVHSIGIALHRLLYDGPIPEETVAEDVLLLVSGPIHPTYVLLCSYLDCKAANQPAKYPLLSDIHEKC